MWILLIRYIIIPIGILLLILKRKALFWICIESVPFRLQHLSIVEFLGYNSPYGRPEILASTIVGTISKLKNSELGTSISIW